MITLVSNNPKPKPGPHRKPPDLHEVYDGMDEDVVTWEEAEDSLLPILEPGQDIDDAL